MLIVLLVLFILTINAFTFVSMMHGQQAAGGARYRKTAAFYLAEAALARAVWLLENSAEPGGVGGVGWRPTDHREVYRVGALDGEVRIRIADENDGHLALTGQGEVASTVREIRMVARLTPGALRYPLFSRGAVWLDGEARTYLVPLQPGARPCERPGGHLAAGGEIWVRDQRVRLNALESIALDLTSGTVRDHELFGFPAAPHPADPAFVDAIGSLTLLDGAPVHVRDGRKRVTDPSSLSSFVPGTYVRSFRTGDRIDLPAVDFEHYRALAARNRENAALHKALGWEGKEGSVYTAGEIGRILDHLNDPYARVTALRGVVYMVGNLTLASGQRLAIDNGALIVDGSLVLQSKARLQVRQGDTAGRPPGAERLPGVVTRGGGVILIGPNAKFATEGLVFASGTFDVHRDAFVDIAGSLLAAGPGVGFRNGGGTVVIRYDPAVMRTAGIRLADGARGVAVAPISWQEVR
ncbi:MAG: hypothetical protein ACRDIC_14595 [bacterium]